MREILFRGKRIDNGEWAEGYLIYDELCNTHIPYIGYLFDAGHDVDIAEIVLGTVGQYSGLTDKNGKKIFEGDIVYYTQPDDSKAYGLVKFGEYGGGGTCHVGFYINWFGRYDTGWLRNDIGFWAKYREIEIIGNIHDNPDLLDEK